MRTENEILDLILDIANQDSRVRAVVLNGSRVNEKIKKDIYQDFDVRYFVTDLKSFESKPDWINVFGERLIMQMPNSMNLYGSVEPKDKTSISYLMLFKDCNRIDLTLFPLDEIKKQHDSLSKVLLDKDNLFLKVQPANDKDCWIIPPTEKSFADCCNEFWWVSTYLVKAIARNELVHAKTLLEGPIRDMLFMLMGWWIGHQNNYAINIGSCNRFIKLYVPNDLWIEIEQTYPKLDKEEINTAHQILMKIFKQLSAQCADWNGYSLNLFDIDGVEAYINFVRRN